MSDSLYNDYKNNCYEYMKTVNYTEKIIKDNNSDQNKLLNIYEKAVNSAESMFKRMQLEVETNSIIGDRQNELNEIHTKITEYKYKLKKYKDEFLENNLPKKNVNNNFDDDRAFLLTDIDILEKGDVYINQSKILLDNSEYISNDVMRLLNKQKESLKKNISNISFVTDKLDIAKNIMKSLKNKDLFNKYRLYIIYIFIFLTFSFVTIVKYNRYVSNTVNPATQNNNLIHDINNVNIQNEPYNHISNLPNLNQTNMAVNNLDNNIQNEQSDTNKIEKNNENTATDNSTINEE
ncbi:vesicle transport v-SNARE protein VTI1, putative [Plasmodium chabaudi chabaudi]|uniref:Vesicle transport v-SNARE protein VTI1, putative n=1 Tax=Plasmodium chabaudi chabaudi TaxID=31271 RepID=A0A077TRT0_PLACU|nr:vesicle transport v-SNARE protein VTI1, putative [Plasmodium chabaudi chabaudi]SCM26750.1 vesicle transport v-SNARE protein VTI1, putative [Plasmodium chabaudi chabaudi]VTZ71204.1 vesicle transport v-SNARE protein VTI1, putative [Plasmodium chabaudi chabaudi]|eukprot:XP_741922.2 vesicle transport v-SNARE protein VTI1, putative [Plasmodium chabaudi chabaudi]